MPQGTEKLPRLTRLSRIQYKPFSPRTLPYWGRTAATCLSPDQRGCEHHGCHSLSTLVVRTGAESQRPTCPWQPEPDPPTHQGSPSATHTPSVLTVAPAGAERPRTLQACIILAPDNLSGQLGSRALAHAHLSSSCPDSHPCTQHPRLSSLHQPQLQLP